MPDYLAKPKSVVELAARLSELGYWPVPIPRGCKGPSIAGWQNLRLTPEQVPDYFREGDGMLVGILHNNVLALDVDVYDADLSKKISDEALRRFPGALLRIGQPPKSAVFLRMEEPGFKVHNTEKHEVVTEDGEVLSAQVEVRSVSRQIVAYGVHPSTNKPYNWPLGELWSTPREDLPVAERGSIEAFRDWCDEEIRKWAGISEGKVIDLGTYTGRTLVDERPTEEQFTAALSHVSSNVGYDEWLRGLMAIHDFYEGSQAGLQVAHSWSSSYPDYSHREVETKWKSFEAGKGTSYKTIFYLAKISGADMSEIARIGKPERTVSEPEPEPVTQKTITDFRIDSSADFLADLEPLEYLIDGLLPRGVTYSLTGHAGHGKTTLALQFALSVALGEDFAGRAVSQGDVLILAGENPYNVKWQYAAALAARSKKPQDVPIHFVQGRFSIKQFGDVLRAKMDAMPRLKLVIVDSLQAFFEGDNDNDNTQMVEMAHKMRHIGDTSTKPAMLVIAHPAGKVPSKDSLVPRGGGAFLNEIDGNLTVWSQDASQQTLHHSQKFRGAGFDPVEFVMQIHEFPHLTDINGVPLKLPVSRPELGVERVSREQQTDTFLRRYLLSVDSIGGLSVREMAAQFGISRYRAQSVVETARDEKLIKRYAKKFVLTDGGKAFLEDQNAG